MPEIFQMIQREHGCLMVVEDDVGHALDLLVSGNRNGRKRGGFLHGSVYRDDALDAALGQ